MKIVSDSHLDHGLTQDQVNFLAARFADRGGFFIETVELPEELGTVPCGLRGPIMGDEPVSDLEVVLLQRGTRSYTSRIHSWLARQVRTVTVIAGPHGDDPCVLYTAFGGPLAPQEPGELERQVADLISSGASEADLAKVYLKLDESKKFWAHHALTL